MRSSSLVRTFKRSSLTSPATPIIARAYSPVLAARGAWGGLFRVDLDGSRETGHISLVVLGDADHAAFDNITFVDDKDTVLVAEDRGDTLHDQLNKLDSIWAYRLNGSTRREISWPDSLRSAGHRCRVTGRRQRTDWAAHVRRRRHDRRIDRDEGIQERPGEAVFHPATRRKQSV